MKKSYLNSERNSAVSLKPSMTIRLLLMVLFVCLFGSTTITAQISALNSWSKINTINAAETITYNVSTGSNTNRMLVVAIASSRSTNGAITVALTYGGQQLKLVKGDMGINTARQHTQLYYLDEAGIDAATNSNLIFGVTGGIIRGTSVFAAVFDGVEQTNPITDSKTYSSLAVTTSNPVFAPGLTVNPNDQAVEIISSVRTASTTSRTIVANANWTIPIGGNVTWSSTDAGRNAVANRSIPAVISADVSSTTFSGSALASMTGMSLKCAPTTPTITSLGSLSGCEGSSITINGTNLRTVIAADLKIGETAVTSLTCNAAGTQIVVVIGAGTTGGVVTATNYWGTTATSADTFTVNDPPSVVATPAAAQTIANGAAIVPIVISDSNNVPGTIFTWSRSVNANITGTIDASGSSLKGNLTNTSTFVQTVTFTVTATSGGCSSSTTVTVTVLPSFNISYNQNSDNNVQTIPSYGPSSTSGSNTCTSVDGTGNDLDLYSGWYDSNNIPIPGLTYKWQYKKVADATWTNMPGTSVTDVAATVMYTPGTYLFRLMVTTTAGLFMDYSDILTLTVIDNTIPNNGGNFANQTVCIANATPPLFIETTPIIGELTYKWYSSSTQNGTYNLISGATSATYQAAAFTGATTSMWFYRLTTYIDGGSCTLTSKSNTFSLTIGGATSAPAAPTVIVTQPTCAVRTSGKVTISNPINGYTYYVTGTGTTTTIYTNTTGVFGTVAIGTYNVTAKNTCSATPSSAVSVTISMSNTYNGSAWSNGTPTADQDIIFEGDYPPIDPALDPNVDIVGCSCRVKAGFFEVTIKTGHTMTITNEVIVDLPPDLLTPGGLLTFEDGASLVQINNVANTGDIDYLRTTVTGIYNEDYIYWSSPVGGITLGDVSENRTLSDKYYSYLPTATGEDWQQEYDSTPMVAGNGYIIRGPEISQQPSNKYTATFTGIPNNGTYSCPSEPLTYVIADRSYLLGNPYPSALDADTFLARNVNVLDGTLYFWTHNTDMKARALIGNNPDGTPKAGSGAYAYITDDYATYNSTGGVGAGAAAISVPGSNNNYNTPSGKIASGQGFFASSKLNIPPNSKIVFDNMMRVGVNGIKGENSQFFKTKKPNGKTANAIEKNRVWLNITNTGGAFKQTLVGYITDATNDYDDRFDGESFDGNEFVDFYSVNQDKNLVIQGRALPFDENDEVPLGYRTTINGDFTINIDQVDGSLTNQAVFIEDKLTNTVIDLKSGNYTFNTAAGTFDDRFVLKYTNKTLSVDAMDKEDGILVLYSNNYKTLIIHNNVMDSTVNTVTLYNIMGQKISNWDVKDSEQTTIQIPIKSISSGIYIVKVNTTIGESSKKIIVN